MYSYCRNAVLQKTDPEGFDEIDITDQLNATMAACYDELVKYKEENGYAAAILFFIENVKTGGDWDLKHETNWNLTYENTYIYNGIPLRFDEPGNILFGYVGSALFDLPTQYLGAGGYQILSGTAKWEWWQTLGDDPVDTAAVTYGYLLKQKQYPQYWYFTVPSLNPFDMGFDLIKIPALLPIYQLSDYEEEYRNAQFRNAH